MKLFFKVIILFMIVFNFRMPYVYNSVVLADIFVAFYYFFIRKSAPFTYFSLRYNVIILIGTIVIALINVAFTVLHEQYFFQYEKRFILQFFMLSSFIFSLPLFIEDEEGEAFEKMSVLICYTFALQGLIHLTAYLYSPLGEYLYTMKGEGFNNYMIENGIDKFRGYALTGSIFFELPAAYGVVCVIFFRLQLMEGQKYLSGLKAYIVLFLLVSGISLSGRTGFVGAFLGLFLFSIFSFSKFYTWMKNIWKIALAVALSIVFFYYLLPQKQQNRLSDEVFPFAFEAYYNYRDYGTLSTGSSDQLEQHYFPIKDETFLVGHGTVSGQGGFYPGSDAGYINVIIFGGVPYILCLSIYQFLYCAGPLGLTRRRNTLENKQDFLFFLLLFIHMYILEYKADALGTQHITEVLLLAVGSTYMIRYYYQLEHG